MITVDRCGSRRDDGDLEKICEVELLREKFHILPTKSSAFLACNNKSLQYEIYLRHEINVYRSEQLR